MILIITHKEDYTADFVIAKLNERSIPYFRFNCEDYLDYDILVGYGKSSGISINGFTQFSSVWYRRTKLPDIMAPNESERLYILGEIDTFMNNLFAMIESKWLSHPFFLEIAENKLFQLKLAKKIGFLIPETIVTTSADTLRKFLQQQNKNIIKPLGSGKVEYLDNNAKLIFTNELPKNLSQEIETYVLTPAIYQGQIEKDYEIRVTVIGHDVFAAKIDSQKDEATRIDWRRSPKQFEAYTLPDDIKDKCVTMLKELNISFGAFDLIKGVDGEYYFLEINPNGQWVWIEKETGQQISDSLIRFLA